MEILARMKPRQTNSLEEVEPGIDAVYNAEQAYTLKAKSSSPQDIEFICAGTNEHGEQCNAGLIIQKCNSDIHFKAVEGQHHIAGCRYNLPECTSRNMQSFNMRKFHSAIEKGEKYFHRFKDPNNDNIIFEEPHNLVLLYDKLSYSKCSATTADGFRVDHIFLDHRSYMLYRFNEIQLCHPALVVACTSSKYKEVLEPLNRYYNNEGKQAFILQDPFVSGNEEDRIQFILTVNQKKNSVIEAIRTELYKTKIKLKVAAEETQYTNNNLFLVECNWRRPQASLERIICRNINCYIGEINNKKQFTRLPQKNNREKQEDLLERFYVNYR